MIQLQPKIKFYGARRSTITSDLITDLILITYYLQTVEVNISKSISYIKLKHVSSKWSNTFHN